MEKTCLQCGIQFRVKPSHAEKRVYCSRECMSIGYSSRMRGDNNPNYRDAGIRTCNVCGNTYQSYDKTRKYCSWTCAGKAQIDIADFSAMGKKGGRPKKSIKERHLVCTRCKKPFIVDKKRNNCPACSTYGKAAYRTCVVCGGMFHSPAFQKTCSKRCFGILSAQIQKGEQSHLWRGGKTQEAKLFRSSVEYGYWRRDVFARDDYTCQLCGGRGGRLTAHHIKLFSQHRELAVTVSNGITLCWSCHGSIKGKEREYEEYFYDLTGGIK